MGLHDDAIAALRSLPPPASETAAGVEHAALFAKAFLAFDDEEQGRRWMAVATSRASTLSGVAAADALVLRATWALRDNDDRSAAAFADEALCTRTDRTTRYGVPLATVRAEALEVRALLSESREDYADAAELLELAWQALYDDPDERPDRFVEARLLARLAPLVLDLNLTDLTPRLQAATMRPWASALRASECTVRRTRAWQAALAGQDKLAFAQLLECVSLAPTDIAKLAAVIDRAELAGGVGNDVIAYEERRRVSALARAIDWEFEGEDGLLLLAAAAKAIAVEDSQIGRTWLSQLTRLSGARRRSVLFQRRCARAVSDANVAVLTAESRTAEALAISRRNVRAWDAAGCSWRAAREAAMIARLSSAQEHYGEARARCAAFPLSWFARTLGSLRGSSTSDT